MENNKTEIQAYYEYLLKNTVTNTVASDELQIPQKNLCRLKRKLEDNDRLWVLKYERCPITNEIAGYLTTNPALKPENYQKPEKKILVVVSRNRQSRVSANQLSLFQ